MDCLLFLVMALEATVSYFLNPTGSAYEFIVLLSGYLAVPVYLLIITNLRIPKSMVGWMQFISWVYIGYFLMMSIVFPSYRKGTDALMLGFSNSNRTGTYMLLVIILSIVASANDEKKVLWYARKVCEVALLYFIAATQSRTSFLLAFFAEVISLLPVLPRLSKRVIRICIIIPAVFLWAYTLAYSMNWLINVEILGKTIYSGRQILFVIETLPISLFGNYAVGQFGGLNVAQSILNTLGLMGLIIFYLFYFRLTASTMFTKGDRKGTIAIICFSLLFLHGCTENMLMTGGSVYAGMIGCILLTIKAMNEG